MHQHSEKEHLMERLILQTLRKLNKPTSAAELLPHIRKLSGEYTTLSDLMNILNKLEKNQQISAKLVRGSRQEVSITCYSLPPTTAHYS
jgi:hypothetical protein